jgi:uracil-DNA glycosylase family 4
MSDKIDRASLYYFHKLKLLGFEYGSKKLYIDDEDTYSLPGSIEDLREIVNTCTLCKLSNTRKNIVFGEGDIKSDLFFVGEAPGAMEDDMGRPFVGKAGELLTKIIENVLLRNRSSVYIANIIKCRPPNNRVPSADEADSCKSYILKQLDIVRPKVIVALGATSFKYLTNDHNTSISKARGEVIEYGRSKLVATFHPSYLLRNPSAKRDVYNDMLKVKSLL